MSRRSPWIPVIAAVARRPDLWPTAIGQLSRLAPPGWWRTAPFLPVPPAAYRRFRLETAFGSDPAVIPAGDVVAFLEWCRHRW